MAFRRLAAVGPGDNRAFDGAGERVAVHLLVRNVGKRDRDEWVAEINHRSAGIGWTGADPMAIFGSNVETEARASRFWIGLIGVGESCGIGLSDTDAGHQEVANSKTPNTPKVRSTCVLQLSRSTVVRWFRQFSR